MSDCIDDEKGGVKGIYEGKWVWFMNKAEC